VPAYSRTVSHLYRNFVLGMGGLAVAGYLVALVWAGRGVTHYQNYILAHTDCVYAALNNVESQVFCSMLPGAQAPLLAYREITAVGDSFLHLALALTVAVLLAPLFRRVSGQLVALLQQPSEAVQPVVSHDMIPAVSRPRLPGW
jgi:hypothetical protein